MTHHSRINGLIALMLSIICVWHAPMSHAQERSESSKQIYVPIVESFIPLSGTQVVDLNANNLCRDGGVCSFTPKTCQELFRTIQRNANTTQDNVIRQLELYTTFPQCFVIGDTGVGLIENYLGMIYQWMAGIVGAVAVLMIIVGSIQIAMGGADQNNVSEGKNRIIQALVGLVVLFLSGLILYTINPTFFS